MSIEDYKDLVRLMKKDLRELEASNKRLKDLAESLLAANRSN